MGYTGRHEGEERKQWAQGEPATEEGRLDDNEKMEVDEEVDRKKKLDHRKKELVKQLANIDEFRYAAECCGRARRELATGAVTSPAKTKYSLARASKVEEGVAEVEESAGQKEAVPENVRVG